MTSRLASILILILLSTQLAAVAAAPAGDQIHIVRPGDTVYSLARYYGVTVATIIQANGLSNPDRIYVGQRLIIPAPASIVATTTPAAGACGATYTVRRGDTLWSIARRCHVTPAKLITANRLAKADWIYPGQVLQLPAGDLTPVPAASPPAASPCGASYLVQRGDTVWSIALKCRTTVTALATANKLANVNWIYAGQILQMPGEATRPPSASPTPSPFPITGPCGATYVVRAGDTLHSIATKCGVTVNALAAVNNLPNVDWIYVGQVLKIPGGTQPTPPPTPTIVSPLPTASATSSLPTPPPPPTTETSATLTASPSLAATVTATPPSGPSATLPPPTRGIIGQLTLCYPPKPSYAAHVERICMREVITNTTNATVSYSILGIKATNLSGGTSPFHTSWSGYLSVPPYGTGPIAGGWEDGIFLPAGTYRLTLNICYLSAAECRQQQGWETLTGGIDVTVVNWTPTPP